MESNLCKRSIPTTTWNNKQGNITFDIQKYCKWVCGPYQFYAGQLMSEQSEIVALERRVSIQSSLELRAKSSSAVRLSKFQYEMTHSIYHVNNDNEKQVRRSKNESVSARNSLGEKGKIWPQILAILIGCLGSINMGIIMTWSSPYAVQIVKDKRNYNINEAQASYFSILPSLGMMLSCIMFAKLTDIIGRKCTYMLIVIPQIMFWTATLASTNVHVLWAARFISGFGDGCYFTSFPVYVAEVSTPKVRGILGSAVTYFAFLGQFLSNLIGYFLNVKECAYVCIGLPVIFLVLFACVPESPYYFVMKGRDDEAKRSLKMLSRKQDVDCEFSSIKEGVTRQMSMAGTWKEIVTIKTNRKAFIAASILRISQQLSGMPVFALNTQLLFQKAGGSMDARVSSMIFAGLCFIFYMLNGFVIDRLGRRVAEISSLLLCAFVSFVEAAYFYIDQHVDNIDLSRVSWVPLAGLIAFVIFSSLGIATIPTLMCGELFATSIKSKAFTIQIILFGAFMSVVNYLFHHINSYTGLYGPFALFGLCNVISSILCYFYIPETRGKTLEEIQQQLKKN